MGFGRLSMGIATLALAGCGGSAPPSSPPSVSTDADGLRRAVAVWEHGAEAIDDEPTTAPNEDVAPDEEDAVTAPAGGASVASGARAATAFRDFDARARRFLAAPHVLDAVQFSCAVGGYPDESWVEQGLENPDPAVRLRALVVLVRVRAPRSVAKQWSVLQDLWNGPRAVEFAQVTTRLRAAFSAEALDLVLAEPPPGTRYSTPPAYQWALRAAGVTGHRGALGRLTDLSRSDLLDVSLAAERSLEDFDGPEGDAALARCVDGWQYNAAMRAATALLTRDPERLRSTLLAASPPKGEAYWKGVYLARLEDRRGVPILCDEVPGLQIIDREMFDAIERLAGPEDLPHVEALPERVRPEQRARADQVRSAVRARLDRGR